MQSIDRKSGRLSGWTRMGARPALRGALCVMLVVCVAGATVGCGEVWRRKFVRKKKADEKPRIVLSVDEGGESKPIAERYETHYLYWRMWQMSAVDLLDRSSTMGTVSSMKRIRDTIERAASELATIHRYLADEPAARLQPYVEDLQEMLPSLGRDLTIAEATRLQRQLDQQRREIERDFAPKKVGEFLKVGKVEKR